MEQLVRLRPATVLVVENEAIVLVELADWLAEVGLTVLTAFSADEALDLLSVHPEVALLLTDITMPGPMDGLELARLASERRPLVKIIVTSGQMDPPQHELPTGGVFVPKPLERPRLWRALSLLLEEDATPPEPANVLLG